MKTLILLSSMLPLSQCGAK